MVVCQNIFGMDYESASMVYQHLFCNNKVLIVGLAVALVFFVLLGIVVNWFIHRYQDNKTEITGVINEPWHYRYVGKEVAAQMYEQDICLEEYLESEGKTAGSMEMLKERI